LAGTYWKYTISPEYINTPTLHHYKFWGPEISGHFRRFISPVLKGQKNQGPYLKTQIFQLRP